MLRYWALALAGGACVAAGLAAAHQEGQDEHAEQSVVTMLDCERLPPNAVRSLPQPVAAWVQVACRDSGQLLVESPEWQWRFPSSYTTPVLVPASTASRDVPGPRYFIAVTVAARQAAAATQLHEALSRDVAVYADIVGTTAPSSVYTLVASNDLGEELQIHFVPRSGGDLLGVVCAPKCIPESAFIVQKRGG